MKKVAVITGANKGLGEAIVDLLLQDDDTVIFSLSRSLSSKHTGVSNDKLMLVKTDLSQPFDPCIAEFIKWKIMPDGILYIFNNAGTISPICKVADFEEHAIETSVKVNIQYPVNLINLLLKKFGANKIVLVNISSGAGVNPVAYWSLYCAAKAYIKMFLRVLAEENPGNENLKLYDIDPGVLDTAMQQEIRDNFFPRQDYFNSLKEGDRLLTPATAASNILKQIGYL